MASCSVTPLIDADELPGNQSSVRVRKDCTGLDGPGLQIHSLGCGVDLAGVRVDGAVAVVQLDREIFRHDRFCAPLVQLAEILRFRVGEREHDVGGVEPGDRGEQRLLRLDERSHRRGLQGRDA